MLCSPQFFHGKGLSSGVRPEPLGLEGPAPPSDHCSPPCTLPLDSSCFLSFFFFFFAVEPVPHGVEALSPNHCTAREFPRLLFLTHVSDYASHLKSIHCPCHCLNNTVPTWYSDFAALWWIVLTVPFISPFPIPFLLISYPILWQEGGNINQAWPTIAPHLPGPSDWPRKEASVLDKARD